MKIGYIGLGAMGAPMTARLVERFPGEVLAFDPQPETLARVVLDTGAEASESVGDLASKADVIFTCVPDNDIVKTLYLDPDGIASAIRPGSITIDCSTVVPQATQEVSAHLAPKDVHHLDASMLGSVKQANEGTISFVVGGDKEAFDRAEPVLKACGEMIRHCGPSGSGNQMKLVHQTLVAGHAVAVAEALGLAAETGLDVEQFFDVVTQGTGFAYSRYFENRVPRMQSGEFSPLFMLKFMLKDARYARAMTDTDGYPALDAVIATLAEADAAGHGSDDFSAALKAVQARLPE